MLIDYNHQSLNMILSRKQAAKHAKRNIKMSLSHSSSRSLLQQTTFVTE